MNNKNKTKDHQFPPLAQINQICARFSAVGPCPHFGNDFLVKIWRYEAMRTTLDHICGMWCRITCVKYMCWHSNMTTGGRTSLTASSTQERTVWWWFGTREVSGTTCPAITTWPSPVRREQVCPRRNTHERFGQVLLMLNPNSILYQKFFIKCCCVPFSVMWAAACGERCSGVWSHEAQVWDQLAAPLWLQTRFHPKTHAHYTLSRQWSVGQAPSHLHEPWVFPTEQLLLNHCWMCCVKIKKQKTFSSLTAATYHTSFSLRHQNKISGQQKGLRNHVHVHQKSVDQEQQEGHSVLLSLWTPLQDRVQQLFREKREEQVQTHEEDHGKHW